MKRVSIAPRDDILPRRPSTAIPQGSSISLRRSLGIGEDAVCCLVGAWPVGQQSQDFSFITGESVEELTATTPEGVEGTREALALEGLETCTGHLDRVHAR